MAEISCSRLHNNYFYLIYTLCERLLRTYMNAVPSINARACVVMRERVIILGLSNVCIRVSAETEKRFPKGKKSRAEKICKCEMRTTIIYNKKAVIENI